MIAFILPFAAVVIIGAACVIGLTVAEWWQSFRRP